jgi:IS5 family transposase
MDNSIPWDEWVAYIVPYYPEAKRGRPPIGIEKMLRMYLLQCWFNLSDEGLEDAIYDSYAMRTFMGVNFFEEQVPDATTLLKFRHLLEEYNLGKMFFDAIVRVLTERGHMMRGGSIVDAAIINAPSSTKNEKKERDPEMHQTKKGNEWYFGMKCHAAWTRAAAMCTALRRRRPMCTI